MGLTLEELEVKVRDRICSVCTDRLEDGNCGLEDRNECALFHLFPQVARAITSTHSDDIQDYIQAIRKDVCSVCRQDEKGECETRKEVRCALDAYLLLIVDTIEECTGRVFDRVGLPQPGNAALVTLDEKEGESR